MVYFLLFSASVQEILEEIVSQSMNDKKMNHFIWLRSLKRKCEDTWRQLENFENITFIQAHLTSESLILILIY